MSERTMKLGVFVNPGTSKMQRQRWKPSTLTHFYACSLNLMENLYVFNSVAVICCCDSAPYKI